MPVKYVEILEVDPDMFIQISKQFVLRKIKIPKWNSKRKLQNCVHHDVIHAYKCCHNIECSTSIITIAVRI